MEYLCCRAFWLRRKDARPFTRWRPNGKPGVLLSIGPVASVLGARLLGFQGPTAECSGLLGLFRCNTMAKEFVGRC